MKKGFIDEHEVFALGDDLEASVHTIGPEKSKIVTIDNFYKNPDMVRDLPYRFHVRIIQLLWQGRLVIG